MLFRSEPPIIPRPAVNIFIAIYLYDIQYNTVIAKKQETAVLFDGAPAEFYNFIIHFTKANKKRTKNFPVNISIDNFFRFDYNYVVKYIIKGAIYNEQNVR